MITGGASGPRHSYGSVTAGGTIENAGSGDWSVSLTSVGVYAVTFLTPFITIPTVSVDLTATNAMIIANAFAAYLQLASYSQAGFTCETAKGSTLVSTVGFDFIAVGT
jgi:hypothetical protein